MAEKETKVTVEAIPEPSGPSPLDKVLARARAETPPEAEQSTETVEAEAGEQTRPEAEAAETVETAAQDTTEKAPEEADAARVEVRLPGHFREHNGVESIRVDPKDVDIVNGLVASFEAKAERETKSRDLQDAEERLMQEVDDFRLAFQANPLGAIDQMVGTKDAARLVRVYLLNNPEAWREHATWFQANAYDEGALLREKRDAAVELRERRLDAQQALQSTKQEREIAAQARNEFTAGLAAIDPTFRDFAQPRMQAEIRQALQAGKGIEGVKAIVADWKARFGAPGAEEMEEETTELVTSSGRPALVKPPAVQLAEKKREQAKKVRTVRSGGTPEIRPSKVRGKTLDQVLAEAKAGTLPELAR